jgi:hypothetical protein
MNYCTHRNIQAWKYEDGPADFWSCVDCQLKFAPITREIELERELAAAQAQINAFYMGTPEARLLAMTKERDVALARLEELERDAARWRFAWEHDLVLHQWDGMWWCTRTDFCRNEHDYPEAATKEAAIDAAMEAK